jgi:hypothetical protein
MKVFISWSGDRSKAVAELLDEWLQCVLQAIDPWMSSKDIDRGSLWFSEISDQLADTKIGVICLTQDNKTKPWILFEAGALAKGLSSSRVCTFLIDLEPTDVGNPLAQFNHTFPNHDGVYELLRTINSSLGDRALKEKVLEKVFETYWPQFDAGFKKALGDNQPLEPVEPRSKENMLEEVLTSVRRLDRRMREIELSGGDRQSELSLRESERRKDRIPTSLAREIIAEMIQHGMPEEFVLEHLAERGAPRSFTKNTIRELLDERKSAMALKEEG